MNKSTPIVQLPSNGGAPQQQNFMNDQQRQYIAQAQQAISNTTMPQNTQLSNDIVNDDDVVVQDILNQINSVAPMENQQAGAGAGMDNATLNQMMQMQQMYMPQMQQAPQMQQMPQMQHYTPQHVAQMENVLQPVDYKTYIHHFADDIKLAAIVFFVVIVIHFVPLSSWVARYIAVDKIPYHDIILRAILATLLVVIIKKVSKI